jgi:hypothetical protein
MNFRALAIFVAGFVCGLNSAQGQERVRIIRAGEGWSVDGRELGTSVAAEAKISGKEKASGLALRCKNGQEELLIEYSCDKACSMPPCGTGDGVKRQDARLTTRLMAAVFSLTEREGPTMVTLAARAGGTPNDALLLVSDTGIDFSSALRRVVEGKYCFRLTGAGMPVRTFTLDWDRERANSGRAIVNGVAQGIFRLEKAAEGGCERDPETGSAWVAVLPGDLYAAAQSSWSSAEQWATQAEKDGLSAETIAQVRHAVLDDLVRSGKP